MDLIRCVADEGRVGSALYCLMKFVANLWLGDIQELEGIMNMIKLELKRSPSIGTELLDARVANRKAYLQSVRARL